MFGSRIFFSFLLLFFFAPSHPLSKYICSRQRCKNIGLGTLVNEMNMTYYSALCDFYPVTHLCHHNVDSHLLKVLNPGVSEECSTLDLCHIMYADNEDVSRQQMPHIAFIFLDFFFFFFFGGGIKLFLQNFICTVIQQVDFLLLANTF